MNKISPNAKFYGNIVFGENVRVDDFCILTGNIVIGDNVHIACHSFFSGGDGIIIEDFAQFGPRTSLLTASDDYSGRSMVGPCIPDMYKPFLKRGKIIIKKHVLLGINTTVMPGVTIGEGCSVGAYSFVKESLLPWGMYVGIPAKFIKRRSMDILNLEEKFKETI
jgi:galactoside O-acetyltransferase